MVLKDHGDDILKPDESDMETRETTRDTWKIHQLKQLKFNHV